MTRTGSGEGPRRIAESLPPGRVEEVRLGELTTFRVGGAATVVTLSNPGEVEEVLRICSEFGLAWYVLGRGSNVLVPDSGIDGVVVRLGGRLASRNFTGTGIEAGAGASLPPLCGAACMSGLSGLSFAVGIPGTVGGAIVMNAGAYGRSISDVVERVRCFDGGALEWLELGAEECLFGYRSSLFRDRRELLITGAVLELPRSDPERLVSEARKYLGERRKRFPLSLPNCGSVFKRPVGNTPPGRLIEDAGLKGTRIGGAMVSDVHANFIVNLGDATSGDIRELMELVKNTVLERTGVLLEEEVELIGW